MPRLPKVPTPPPADCLWTPEAAIRIGLSKKTLHNYRHLDKGPAGCFAVGRKLAWPIAGLDAWLDEQRNPAPDESGAHDSRPPEPRVSRTPARAAA